MTPRPMRRLAFTVVVDLRQRIRVHLDHVVEEPHRQAHHPLELVPVEAPTAPSRAAREHRDVDRAEVARLVREERLLAALWTTKPLAIIEWLCGSVRSYTGRGPAGTTAATGSLHFCA